MRIGRLVIKYTTGTDPRVLRGDVTLWSLSMRNQVDCSAAGLGTGTVSQLLRNTSRDFRMGRESFLTSCFMKGFY